MKLSTGELHLLKLIQRDRNIEGWTKVSKQVWPLITDSVLSKLVELRPNENGGYAKLTRDGAIVLEWS